MARFAETAATRLEGRRESPRARGCSSPNQAGSCGPTG